MSNLSDNVTGSWIRSTRYFGHTPHRIPVILYVEGDKDIPFWEMAVASYQSKFDISVRTNQAAVLNESKGKTFLLTMSGLCQNKVVAVDADFDILIDDYCLYTKLVRNGEYVIHTTFYSLENILLHSSTYINMLRSFSRLSYSWFLNHLAEIELKEESQPKVTFGNVLTECKVQKCASQNNFSEFAKLIENKVLEGSDDKNAIKKKYHNLLISLGYSEEDAWLLMRGHNLWDSIVKPIEVKRVNNIISETFHTKKAQGENVTKNEIMNSLGIYESVKDYVENQFYYQVANVSIPSVTINKLDSIFN